MFEKIVLNHKFSHHREAGTLFYIGHHGVAGQSPFGTFEEGLKAFLMEQEESFVGLDSIFELKEGHFLLVSLQAAPHLEACDVSEILLTILSQRLQHGTTKPVLKNKRLLFRLSGGKHEFGVDPFLIL
jgi:hypothetical protein